MNAIGFGKPLKCNPLPLHIEYSATGNYITCSFYVELDEQRIYLQAKTRKENRQLLDCLHDYLGDINYEQ